MGDCPFCRIVELGDALVVYRDERAVAFLDRAPASRGHTLVVPRRHVPTVLEIDPDEAGAVMAAGVRVAGLLQDALDPNGFTLLQANEVAGWQSIFHLHLHVIPRWDENELESPWWPQPAAESDLRALARSVLDVASRPYRGYLAATTATEPG